MSYEEFSKEGILPERVFEGFTTSSMYRTQLRRHDKEQRRRIRTLLAVAIEAAKQLRAMGAPAHARALDSAIAKAKGE
jgi:hypothetical protein